MAEITVERFVLDLISSRYIDLMKEREEYSQYSNFDLWYLIFPRDWDNSNNVKMKIEFLKKAIETNSNLRSLDGIEIFIEGVFP